MSEIADPSETLLPCPFCGCSAIFCYSNEAYHKRTGEFLCGLYVMCSSCPCEFGRGGLSSQEEDMGMFSSFVEAADEWNNRPDKEEKP